MVAWHPWRALRAREHLEVVVCDLPAGLRAVYASDGDDEAILLSRSLSRAERRAALAHELVHAERGGSGHAADAPDGWATVVAREEARVDDIVARRLVPLGSLRDLVERRAEVEPITAEVAAGEFDVPAEVAARAMLALLRDCDRDVR
jgi:Zn-dependent peptidase ImmA (M78 family)